MTWNYRVVKVEYRQSVVPDRVETAYEIRTAYYPEGAEPDSRPDSIGDRPVAMSGENNHDLLKTLLKMVEALKRPVLDAKDFE